MPRAAIWASESFRGIADGQVLTKARSNNDDASRQWAVTVARALLCERKRALRCSEGPPCSAQRLHPGTSALLIWAPETGRVLWRHCDRPDQVARSRGALAESPKSSVRSDRIGRPPSTECMRRDGRRGT